MENQSSRRSVSQALFHSKGQLASKSLVLIAVCLVGLLIAVTQTGCLGVYSNLAHAVGADMTPAKFDGLEKQKVAVVTSTDNSPYSDDISARLLSRKVHGLLQSKVKGIEMVREEDIARFRDENGWDTTDFRGMGLSVGADKVLAIEVIGLKLYENKTLYRGQCDVHLSVIDTATGDVEFNQEIDEFMYPIHGGQPATETTESRFRKMYLGILASRIARQFHPFDPHEDFGLDSIIAR